MPITVLISILYVTFRFHTYKCVTYKSLTGNNYAGISVHFGEIRTRIFLCCGAAPPTGCECVVYVWVDRAKLLVVVCWGQGSSVSTPSLSRAQGPPLFPSVLGTNKPGSAVLLSTAGCHSALRLINQSQGRLDFKQKQTPDIPFFKHGPSLPSLWHSHETN